MITATEISQVFGDQVFEATSPRTPTADTNQQLGAIGHCRTLASFPNSKTRLPELCLAVVGGTIN